MNLERLGWKPFFSKQVSQQVTSAEHNLVPARVRRQDLDRYHLLTATGPISAFLPGRLRSEAESRADLPVVGDWVLVTLPDKRSEPATIERTLDRISKFSRKEAGDRVQEQVLAANIETVFIVSTLDNTFNAGRIGRYLLLAWHSGARPIIVLNKSDICEQPDQKLAALAECRMDTPVHTISALVDEDLSELRQYIGAGETVALLGSSGVGKSTIINRLLGYRHFDTGEVRQWDGKGRHTTTFRELCLMPGGGLIIDTPGMRELQLWADDSALAASFRDVEKLAATCRFNDCRHESEPDCAVTTAIATGELAMTRLQAYRKLKSELERLADSRTKRSRERRKPHS